MDCERNITTGTDGQLVVEIKLKSKQTIGRFEFTIHNPGYLRGQGKAFELKAKQADGKWITAYKGSVYGTICDILAFFETVRTLSI